MKVELSEKMVKHLNSLADDTTIFENGINPHEASGGNYDDAYSIGWDDGEISLARAILKDINSHES